MSPLALWSFFRLPRSEDGLQPAWLWLMGCLLTLTGVWYVRLWLAGSLNVDDGPYAWLACPWLQLSVSGLLFLAGGAYWRSLGRGGQASPTVVQVCLLSAVALQLVVLGGTADLQRRLSQPRLWPSGPSRYEPPRTMLIPKPGDQLLPLVGHFLGRAAYRYTDRPATAAELLAGRSSGRGGSWRSSKWRWWR